ncbi:transmembrane protein 180-like [Clavelina lepadiformis]|uniref:Transmembrane protein 180-like n=1 Tax=Clavelina lepadiformis TaxID=159417 RepID=A0ABP0H535_CLALP
MMSLNRNAVAYAATTLAASSMNSVFFFYYVKLFLEKYGLSPAWFQWSQVVYMIWNAINDPLFGYLQDNSNWSLFRSRKKAIYYGAPIWALTFLLPWFQWADYTKPTNNWIIGLHLMFTLCAYDSLLTFVLLAQCALSAEISTKHEDRLQLVKYQQVASLLGTSSVLFSNLISNNMEDFFSLQLYCVAIAIAACIFLRFSGANVHTKYEAGDVSSTETLLSPNDGRISASGAILITKQILQNRNFLAFVFMNFFQVFHTTFCSNFLLIFGSHLIPKNALPSIARSIVFGSSYMLPQLFVLLGGQVIRKLGAYRVVMCSFIIQILAASTVYMIGPTITWSIACFFVLDMCIPSAMFSLFNILLSDIIDEDIKINNRKFPQSSMVFGTNALITKPANSLAPMLVVAVLNSYGYDHLKQYGSNWTEDEPNPDPFELAKLHDVMFKLLCLLPIVLSVLQIVVWRFYNLRNTHKTEAKYTEA